MTQSIANLDKESNLDSAAKSISSNAEPLAVDTNNDDICANCYIALSGQFCHSCGQSSKSMIKFFGEVIKELLDDALGYDSRFKHSLMPLLFKPGRLTLDYVKGKRFHYVLPFKLYLITSVLFILLIKNTANTDGITFQDEPGDSTPIEQVEISEKERLKKAKEKIENAFEELPAVTDGIKDEILDAVESEQLKLSEREEAGNRNEDDTNIHLSSGEDDFNFDWNNETGKLDGVDEIENEFARTFFSKINPNLNNWKNDPAPLVESIIEMLPYMMFVILPIFAVFLKLFYLFSKRFYTEHLVFLLHNHSFIYLLMMVQAGLAIGEVQLKDIDYWLTQTLSSTLGFISLALNFWMFIYVFLSMKRFYTQSWKVTIAKTLLLGFIYTVLLSVGMVVSMAFGAYQA